MSVQQAAAKRTPTIGAPTSHPSVRATAVSGAGAGGLRLSSALDEGMDAMAQLAAAACRVD